jgi:O-acetylhomoserine (thiol)-lyase
MDVPDIGTWGNIARESGLPMVLDTTLVTPALIHAADFGAAVTVQSGTKFLTGNGTVLSGGVTDTGIYNWKNFPGAAVAAMVKKTGGDLALLVYLRKVARQNCGASLSPFDAYLALLGADTLDLRMSRHSANVLALAEYLEGRPDVPGVSQVGLESSPWHRRAAKYFGGRWGGLLTFRAGSRERAFAVLKNLKIAAVQTNLGDARTLAIHLESTIHREQTPQARSEAGVTDDLIRVSAGLESPSDLIGDFAEALDAAGG